MHPAFDPRRFRHAAAYYAVGRPPYPPALIRRVVELCGIRHTDRMLDLGCGPGMLAVAFAPFVVEVIGMDPEPEMLRQAQERAHDAENVRFIEGSSFTLDRAPGPFRLVSMGRSFHWMDRPDTLRRLEQMIVSDGAVALFGDSHPDLPDNAWRTPYRAVLERYRGDVTGHPNRQPGWVRHEGILLDSPFSHLESIAVIERREIDLPFLVQRALSSSTMTRAVIEARAAALLDDLRGALAPFMHDDSLTEVVQAYALLAWRPEGVVSLR